MRPTTTPAPSANPQMSDMSSTRPADPQPSHRLSLENIHHASTIVDPVFLDSPQYDCEPLSELLGCELTLKLEHLNPIRSFKGRGASYLMQVRASAGDDRPIVGATAGNWGQALAYVCRAAGRPITIYAALNANPLKIERMRAMGAEVKLEGDDFDAAKAAARAFADGAGANFLEDGREAAVSEGHGTIAIELLARGATYDDVLIPLGNGALLTGIGRWMKAASPSTRLVGVCARGARAMYDSWHQHAPVSRDTADTIADGIAIRIPVPEAVQDMNGTVDEVLLVDDDDIVAAMRRLLQHAGQLVEPSGAAGVAAVSTHRERFQGRRVASVLCGSNMTEEQLNAYGLL